MLRDILIVLLAVWVIGAVLPINSGRPYFAVGGTPSLGYIVAVVLVVILVVDFLVPALRSL